MAVVERPQWNILPSLIWLGMAAGYWLQYMHAPVGTVTSGAGVFVMADIYEAAAAISLPAMVFPALLSLAVVYHSRSQ